MNGRLSRAWRAGLGVGALLIAAVATVGALLDAPWVALALLGLSACVVGLVELWRFQHWAQRPLGRPRQHSVLWREPVDHLYRSLQRERARQHRALARLRRNRAITEALPDAAVITSADGTIEEFNGAARDLLGLTPSDIGLNIAALVRSPEFIAMLRAGTDGRVTASAAVTPLPAQPGSAADMDTGDQIVEFASPFTEGVRLEARRIRIDPDTGRSEAGALLLVRDVSQLNRLLSMRQEFVANVSHELRTPLTVVIGYLEALGDGSLSADEHSDLVKRLHGPTARMKALVDDLLLLTRLESSPRPSAGDLQPVDLALVMHQVAEELPAEASARLRLSIDPDLRLLGVAAEIHSVCLNLVTNAVRYDPDCGPIDISWQRTGEGAELAVSDHGIGIAEEHLARLTERFYRVDLARSRVRGGTGLGLAIVKHVLKRHGARLVISSRLGEGSRFACVFPGRLVCPEAKSGAASPRVVPLHR